MGTRIAPGIPVAIDRPLIGLVVRTFYDLVRRDAVLGPIFNPRVTDWPAHEARIARFWASVLLMSGDYHGSPMQVHLDIPDLTRAHFERWLALFAAALAAVCAPEQAAVFQERAGRIARAFQSVRALPHSGTPALATP